MLNDLPGRLAVLLGLSGIKDILIDTGFSCEFAKTRVTPTERQCTLATQHNNVQGSTQHTTISSQAIKLIVHK
jgi:hypothetical protein